MFMALRVPGGVGATFSFSFQGGWKQMGLDGQDWATPLLLWHLQGATPGLVRRGPQQDCRQEGEAGPPPPSW